MEKPNKHTIKAIFFLYILLYASSAFAYDIQIMPAVSHVYSRFADANKIQFIVGAVSSLVVHEVSHVVFLELRDVDYTLHINGIEGHGKRDYWSDMGGFIGQNAAGFALPRKSDFALGYNTMSAASIISYPIRITKSGDLDSNRRMSEWGLASIAASICFIQVMW